MSKDLADGYVHRRHVSEAAGAPLLFLFHGTGGDENQFFALGRQLLPDAHLVSMRGDVSEGGAARFFRRLAEGRYDMADLRRATHKMARFVSETTAALQPSRVLGLGYSNGANILANVLIEKAAHFDRAVLMHPLIPFQPEAVLPLGPLGVLITAGRRDPICPPDLTQSLARHLGQRGAEVAVHWHPGGHEIVEDELARTAEFLNDPFIPTADDADASGR